jgi:hypothetical protein
MAAAGAHIAATQDPITYGGSPAISQEPVQRKASHSTGSYNEKDEKEAHVVDHENILAKDTEDVEAARTRRENMYHKVRFMLSCALNRAQHALVATIHSGWACPPHSRLVDQFNDLEGHPAQMDCPDPFRLVLYLVSFWPGPCYHG